jgi:hypothetical protein
VGRVVALLAAGLALALLWSLLLMAGTPTFEESGDGCRDLSSAASSDLLVPRIVIGVTFAGWVVAVVLMLGWHRPGRGWALVFALLCALVDLAILLVFDPRAAVAFAATGLFLSFVLLQVVLTPGRTTSYAETQVGVTWSDIIVGAVLMAGPLLLTLSEPFWRWHEISSC